MGLKMSYKIYHAAKFLKKDKQIIPIVLTSESNVFLQNGNLAYDWSVEKWLTFPVSPFSDKLHIHAMLEDERAVLMKRSATYSDQRFGYFAGVALRNLPTSETSFEAFKNFFLSGCDEAEDLDEVHSVDALTPPAITPGQYFSLVHQINMSF